MDFSQLNRLIANSTYRELGLRAKEYLRYLNAGGEEQDLAEITMYKCMVSLLKDLGMEQQQAEKYCDNADNLTELAQYISSIFIDYKFGKIISVSNTMFTTLSVR